MIKLKMKKVKAFLHIFSNSLIPKASYYRKILNTRFIFSFKYFVFLIFALSSIIIFNLINKYSPLKINHWLNEINKSIEQFPPDLNIFINNGLLTTTYNRPYFIWTKNDKNKLKLLLVVDETGSFEKFKQYPSIILLTKTDIFIKQNGQIKKIPLSSINKTQIINKESLIPLKEKISWIKKFFYPLYFSIVVFALILVPFFSFIVNTIYILLASLITFLFLKFKTEKKYHLKKIFQISLHACTLPLLIDYLFFNLPLPKLIKTSFNIKLLPFPFVFIFLLAVFIFIGAYEAYYNHNQNQAPPNHHHKKTHH